MRGAFGRAILELFIFPVRIERMSRLRLCTWTCVEGSLQAGNCGVERLELFFGEGIENWWELDCPSPK